MPTGVAAIETYILVGLLVGGTALAVLRWPAAAMGLLLCNWGLQQYAQANNSFFITHSQLTNYLTVSVLLLAVVVTFVKNQGHFGGIGYPAVGKVIIVLLLYATMSLIWSIEPRAKELWLRNMQVLIPFMVLLPLLVNKPEDLRYAAYSLLIIGSALSLGLLLGVVVEGRMVVQRQGVGMGSLSFEAWSGNPLAVASMAGYMVIAAAMMNFRGIGRVWLILRWFVVALGLALAIRSGSRGQLFAMLVAILVFLPISRQIKSAKGLVTTMAGVAIIIMLSMWAHENYAERNRWEMDTMIEAYQGGRLEMAKTVLDYWVHHPGAWITGLGSAACFAIIGFYPHLVMVEVLVELGLIGFALLWAIPILVFSSLRRLYTVLLPHAEARGLIATFGAMFLFDVILSFKQGELLGSANAFAFAIMLGRFDQAVFRQLSQSSLPTPELPPQALGPMPVRA